MKEHGVSEALVALAIFAQVVGPVLVPSRVRDSDFANLTEEVSKAQKIGNRSRGFRALGPLLKIAAQNQCLRFSE